MRCPSCHFICADIKDLCPKCSSDLRPNKKQIGLPIANPKASYEELLAIASGKAPQATTVVKASPVAPPPAQPVVAPPTPATPPKPKPIAVRLPAPIFNTAPAAEVAQSFDEALRDIITLKQEIEVEIGSEHLKQTSSAEEVNLFFELAEAAIEDPDFEKRFAEQVKSDEPKRLDVAMLQRALDRVEQRIAAPGLSLKARRRVQAERDSGALESKDLHTPTAMTRLASFTADALLVALVAFGLSLLILGEEDRSTIVSAIGSFELPKLSLAVPFAASLLVYALVALVLYQLLSLWVLGQTLGTALCGYRFLRDNGRPLGLANATVRSLILPLSYLMFGYVPALRGHRPWHDAVARVVLCKKAREVHHEVQEEGSENSCKP